MAKESKSPPPPPPAPSVQVQHIAALPAQLPALLAPLLTNGWQVLAIVACRDSNDHVAYIVRTL